MLQTVGGIDEFYKAPKGIEGLEWLADWDMEGIPPDKDFYNEKYPKKELSGRLYLLFSNYSDRYTPDERGDLVHLTFSQGFDDHVIFGQRHHPFLVQLYHKS